jgi:DnaJ-class molecular chaperone
MSQDYYKILGVDKNASKDELKKAFRKQAHKYHPDKKGGDEKKFKEVNEAYNILSDDNKRAQYDQFGSAGFNGAGGGGFGGFNAGGFDFSGFQQGQNIDIDLNDILGSFFRGGGGFSRTRKGQDIVMDIEITFRESIFGVKKELNIPYKSSKTEKIKIDIPAGIDSGEMISATGKGEPLEGGRPGDLYIKIHVKPHKTLHKEGVHIVTTETIKLSESLLGTKREIDTADDKKITVKIPSGIKHGEILKVRGEGVPVMGRRGDLMIAIKIDTPNKLSKKAKEAIEVLQKEGL